MVEEKAAKLRESAYAVHRALLGILSELPVGEHAHALAQWMASFLVGNPCGIYRCDDLEEALLPAAQDWPSLRSRVVHKVGTLHLLSEPYRHGGHTRVVRHLLAHASGDHNVLLTRSEQSAEAHAWLGVDATRVRSMKGHADCDDRTRALAVEIAAYSEVMLYLHPDDVVGGVAVRLARELNPNMRVGFFNHADHAFSVGIGSADCVFEISTYGWQLRRARGIEGCASFVGIPIAVSRPALESKVADEGRASVFLAGTAYKFKPLGDPTLLDALAKLMSSNPGLSVDFAGPGGDEPWWKGLRARFGDRLRFHGLLGHDRYKALLDASAIYVDSYPKTGGTAFPEALMAGARIVGLFGGTWGFSVADALRTQGTDAFVERCEAILRCDASVLNQMEHIRQACEVFHAPAAVWGRISDGLRNRTRLLPPDALAIMPMPPILAEQEWLSNNALLMRLPDRASANAKAVHRSLWRAHAEVFGPLHPGTLRWALTWLSRYALKSG